MNKEAFEVYIYDILYLLNKSELHARVMNFVGEIRKIEKMQEYQGYIDGPFSKTKYLYGLCKISETFNMYYNFYHNFELFIKYLKDDVKIEFAENEIKLLYNKKRVHNVSTLPERPYNFNFAEDNIYNQKTFDYFFNYHRKNIKHLFLQNAMRLTIQYYCL